MTEKRTAQAQETGTLLDAAIADLQDQEGVDAPQRAKEFLIELENQKLELTAYGYDDREAADHLAIARYRAELQLGQQRKGLLIIGCVGSGKTLAIRSFTNSKFYRARDLQKAYVRDENYWDRLKYGELYRYADRDERLITKNFTIDDFGIEPTINRFGTKDECLNEIIEARYELFVSSGARTFITSNLLRRSLDPKKGKKGIAERYGERTLSRLQDMCKIVIFKGTDQRGRKV